MASQWIDAATARQIVGELGSVHQAEGLICKRANAGLIKARAALILVGEIAQTSRDIPKGFWWAQGEAALEQDWTAGDFSTWIEHKHEIKAFGVEFELAGILETLPLARRGEVAARFSVAGHQDWVSADASIRMIAPHASRPARHAESQLIEAARQGFVACRAVEAFAASKGFTAWNWQEREWDVPPWFWEKYTGGDSSTRSFEQNTARGRGRGPIGSYMQLNGIHFWRADLERRFGLADVAAPQADLLVADARPDDPPKNKGGRPRAPFADELMCAIWALIYQGDLKPRRQADIERAMLDWAAANSQELSETAAREKARKIFAAMNNEVKNPDAL